MRLVEAQGTIGFFDIEASGLKGDYNSVLVVSIREGGKTTTYHVKRPGNDKEVVYKAKKHLESLDAWASFYGKGFDIPMLNTRLIRAGYMPIEKRPHLDMYWMLKSNLLVSRRSQAHLLRFFGTEEEKMAMDPEEWNKVLADPEKHMPKMIARCESDVEGLEALYQKSKFIIRDITR